MILGHYSMVIMLVLVLVLVQNIQNRIMEMIMPQLVLVCMEHNTIL